MASVFDRRPNSALRFAVSVSLFLAVVASEVRPALAVPGQTVAAFETWSHAKHVLAGLRKTTEDMSGRPAYVLTMSDHGIAWQFDATVIGATVGRESLTVGSNGTATGDDIRHDGTGYGHTFWKALYGESVAADFRAAHLVFQTRDAVNHVMTTYYRGIRFGYVSAGGLTIETLPEFASDLAQAKTCAARPASCPGD